MVIKHDDLYARAWEFKYEKRSFQKDQDEPDIPKSSGTRVQNDLPKHKASAIAGTIPEICPKTSPELDIILEKTGMGHDTSFIRDTDSENPNPNSTDS